MWNDIVGFFSSERLAVAVRVVVLLVAGWLGARLLAGLTVRVARARRASRHMQQIVRRAVRYTVLAITLLSVLSELGFDLGVLVGAAGLLTVAFGFAAQTSTSNIISGLFLIGEAPFEVGDTIAINGTTGEVLAIDLLSVKLRTFDNLFVRIPNETLLKSELRNLSRFPIRRLEVLLKVPYDVDFAVFRKTLLEVAVSHPYCFDEPAPNLFFNELGDNGYTVQFNVWVARERFLEVRGSLAAQVVAALGKAGIAMAMPRMSVHADAPTPLSPASVAALTAEEPAEPV
ncbi:MAG: mechanosensitive ion channel family protein [Deltaproteobacteria bacterium]|nr:mechanosensitive ion channel family protein [Deltaproteobacteria bacterium]